MAPEATWEPHEKHGRLTKQSDLPDTVLRLSEALRLCRLKPRVAAERSARSSIGESQRLIQETLGPPEPQAYDAESPATTGPKLCGAGELSLRHAYSANVPITP